MKKTIYVLVIALLIVTACKDGKKDAPSKDHSKMEMKNDHNDNHDHKKTEMKNDDGHNHDHSKMKSETTHSEKTIEQSKIKNPATTPIVNAYLQIKNGLVATDKSATAKGATALLKAFKGFDMSKLSGDTHKEYMEILENAKEQAEHIEKSPIDHQREHFEVLSTDITDLVALLGTEKTLYIDHCPMASDGKGANWLSETKNIKNPYFGSKMMKCGSVKRQIN
jgi:hypothetical protein